MKIHTENVTLPAYWASALINGDYSGLTDSEEKTVNAWIKNNPEFGGCFDCSEYPELTIFDGLLTDCLIYTFPINFYRTSDNGINYIVYPAPVKTQYPPWQKLGLQYTRTGYGSKIPTSKMVLLLGVWRRVYCTIYSNIGSCWINFQGVRVNVESIL